MAKSDEDWVVKALGDKRFNVLWDQDKRQIGSRRYRGLAWFHHHDYRFMLRSPGAYADFKHLKSVPSTRWWARKYRELHMAFLDAGLKVSGASRTHDKIINRVFSVESPR